MCNKGGNQVNENNEFETILGFLKRQVPHEIGPTHP